MSQQRDKGIGSYTSGEALAAFRNVKLDAANPKQVVYADAGEEGIGITQEAVAITKSVAVKEWTAGGTFKVTVAGVVAVNAALYAAADGKLNDVAAGEKVAYALEAATADTGIIEVLPIVTEPGVGLWAPDGSADVDADVLAIPITAANIVKTTGADAEALTLADGAPGQVLGIVLGTDGGGDGTLTPATCTGFATIVFADAGDIVSLLFVDTTVGWILLGSAGVAAPPAITV